MNISEHNMRDFNTFCAKLSGALIFSSGVIFLLLTTVSEAIYPGYSIRNNALSDLGAIGSPTQILWDSQLFAVAALSMAGMVLFFFFSNSLSIRNRRFVGVLFTTPGIGSLIVSMVPENLNIVIHTFGAFVNFLFGAISAIYAIRFIRGWFRFFSIFLGLITLFFTTLLVNPPFIGFGGIERMVVYPIVLWNLGFGSYLMSLDRM
ncbi:DUF998 domain-containing protein [Thermoplasmatales archaeon AK]|nr:DUF998 domain-containing protein [Thermoplasmatales archaeon AK]